MMIIDSHSLIGMLNAAVRRAGSQAAFAHQHGISKQYVNIVLSGQRSPGPKILAALNLRPVTGYVLTNGGHAHD